MEKIAHDSRLGKEIRGRNELRGIRGRMGKSEDFTFPLFLVTCTEDRGVVSTSRAHLCSPQEPCRFSSRPVSTRPHREPRPPARYRDLRVVLPTIRSLFDPRQPRFVIKQRDLAFAHRAPPSFFSSQSPARPSPSRWSLPTPSTTSRLRSRTRRAFPPTSSA